jgi:quinoprotein glucose dehydrogenase
VYALEAKTGKLISSFGTNGHIDLRENLEMDINKASNEVTSLGIIYENFLIVGSRVPEGYNSTPGNIRAYDAVIGKFKWVFRTIPKEGEFGFDTWQFEKGETYGSANAWSGFTVDEKRGWVFLATGSPAYDFYGGHRKKR